jgi:aminopeptidase
MGVTAQDRVFIITDYERGSIASRVASVILQKYADVTVRFLEHYGKCPLTVFSDELRNDLLQFHPTVTYYIATAQPGEISFRIPLLPSWPMNLRCVTGIRSALTRILSTAL